VTGYHWTPNAKNINIPFRFILNSKK
jgi:hypothetical protein